MATVNVGQLQADLVIDADDFIQKITSAKQIAEELSDTFLQTILNIDALNQMMKKAVQEMNDLNNVSQALDKGLEKVNKTFDKTGQLANKQFVVATGAVNQYNTSIKNTVRAQQSAQQAAEKAAAAAKRAAKAMEMEQNRNLARIREFSSVLNRTATASFVVGASLVATGTSVGMIGARAVKTASDFVELENKFNDIYGTAAPRFREELEKISDQLGGFSVDELMRLTSEFGDLGLGINITRDQLAAMARDLSIAALDLSSFSNVSVKQATDALRSGIIGQAEPLQRLGINVMEANLKEFAATLGIVHEEMSAGQKMYVRYMAVMDQLGERSGNFVKTNADFANSVRVLRTQFEELWRQLGEALLPAVTNFVAKIRASVTVLVDFTKQNQELALRLAQLITGFTVGTIALGAFLLAMVPVLQTLNILTNGVWLFVKANYALNGGLLKSIILMLTVALKLTVVVGIFAKLYYAVKNFHNEMKSLSGFYNSFIESVVYYIKLAYDVAKKALVDIYNFIEKWVLVILKHVAAAIYAISLEIADLFTSAWKYFQNGRKMLQLFLAIMNRDFGQAISIMKDIAKEGMDNFVNQSEVAASSFMDNFNRAVDDFDVVLTGMSESAKDAFGDLGDFMAIWAKEAGGTVKNIFADMGKDFSAGSDAIKNLISTSLFGLDKNTMDGLLSALSAAFNSGEIKTSQVAMQSMDDMLAAVAASAGRAGVEMEKVSDAFADAGYETDVALAASIEKLKQLQDMARTLGEDALVSIIGEDIKTIQTFLESRAAMPLAVSNGFETTQNLQQQLDLLISINEEAARSGDLLVQNETLSRMDSAIAKMQTMNQTMTQLGQTGGQVFRGLNQGITSFVQANSNMASQVSSGFQSVANNFAESFTDNIFDAITGAQTLQEALQNMFKSLIADLIKTAIRISINYAMAMALSTLFMTSLGAQTAALAGFWSVPATLATIATLGAAAAQAPATLTASLAVGKSSVFAMQTATVGLARGTSEIPTTGMYRLHPGEKVVPAYDAVKEDEERGPRQQLSMVTVLPREEILRIMASPEGQKVTVASVMSNYERNGIIRRTF